MTENSTQHLDPSTLPPWMMEAAKDSGPDAIAWLATGYLAGVETGRKSGPFPSSPPLYVNGFDLAGCALAHGHPGPHVAHAEYRWRDPEPAAGPTPIPVAAPKGGRHERPRTRRRRADHAWAGSRLVRRSVELLPRAHGRGRLA